jgi:hypothetical protein
VRTGGLQELVDRQEIVHLLHEYCRGLDLMDLAIVEAVFTRDCIVDYGAEPGMRTDSAAAVIDGLRALMWRWTRTAHHLSNEQIWFDEQDGDAARGISYVLAWHEFPDGTTTTLFGQYHDRFARTADGWRIAHRRLLMAGHEGNWDVPNHRLERQAPAG